MPDRDIFGEPGSPEWQPLFNRMLSGFHHSIAALAAAGSNLVVGIAPWKSCAGGSWRAATARRVRRSASEMASTGTGSTIWNWTPRSCPPSSAPARSKNSWSGARTRRRSSLCAGTRPRRLVPLNKMPDSPLSFPKSVLHGAEPPCSRKATPRLLLRYGAKRLGGAGRRRERKRVVKILRPRRRGLALLQHGGSAPCREPPSRSGRQKG